MAYSRIIKGPPHHATSISDFTYIIIYVRPYAVSTILSTIFPIPVIVSFHMQYRVSSPSRSCPVSH